MTSTPSDLALAAARRRRVGPAHFAFMRALAQGVELTQAWARYLALEGDARDPRLVRSTLAWIRAEFARAARKEHRFGTARLVRIDVTQLGTRAMRLPGLEEFAQEHGLEDEREADQLAAYERAYGAATARQQRAGALRARQLDALRWLETLIAQPPQAGDSVVAWLPATTAARLEAAGIFTLAQLVERINGIGKRWTGSIRALGSTKGAPIVAWLRAHEDSLKLDVGPHVDRARTDLFRHELAAVVQAATDIRPIEKFVVPSALDGRAGVFRRPRAQCLLAAQTDYEAVLAWLRAKKGPTLAQKTQAAAKRGQKSSGVEQPTDWLLQLSNTQRAYRKEAERFLLWAIVEKRKPLSSLTHEDCVAYRDFLADPTPASRWCGPRSRPRWSPLWRPFEGPLSAAAQGHAVRVLHNLFSFLMAQAYVVGNPWASITVPRGNRPRIDTGRSFSRAQWQFLRAQADALPSTSANLRLKFALALLYATGLRISEAVAARVDDLSWVECPAVAGDEDGEGVEAIEGWELSVIGKGDKPRPVPVPIEVVEQLSGYLFSRGLSRDPEDIGNQGAYLLGHAIDAHERAPNLVAAGGDPRAGIAASTLAAQLKGFFEASAGVLRAQGDEKGAARLERATVHWIRHSTASHALAGGLTPLPVMQGLLGHASLATTSVYVDTEQRDRMKAMQKFWRQRG